MSRYLTTGPTCPTQLLVRWVATASQPVGRPARSAGQALVTAATTALIAGSEHAAPYRDLIMSLLVKNWLDGMGGTGLKLFPDADYSPHNLRNLFYWVFGEWGFSKVSAFGHKPLPHPEWAYAASDGLGNTLPPNHPYAKKSST